MNVASLELCRELYELSGWQTTDGFDYAGKFRYELFNTESRENPSSSVPAYDLGYLLRKLPQGVRLTSNVDNVTRWWAEYNPPTQLEGSDLYKNYFGENADTPEDAACKLCCELIRQGIIKP